MSETATLSYTMLLRRSPHSLSYRQYPIRLASLATFPTRGRLCVGNTAIPIQPPPLRGTSFHRKEGVSTRAPSLGRGCRAQRGGVGFLFLRRSRLLFASPLGKGDRVSGARVLSQAAHLRRSFPLSFIPLVPYPARFARHLPHAGKALCRGQRHSHKCRACILRKQKPLCKDGLCRAVSGSIILRSRILRDFSAYPHHFLS